MQQHAQLRFLAISAIVLAMVFEISAHSQMRCAKYDPASGKCFAPIRNQVESFLTEAYSWFNGAPVCQSPMGKLITDSYANGPSCPDYAGCPDQMGVYRPSETFTVMWYARNHAVDNQSPGTVSLYLSPNEANNQGSDFAQGGFTKFCEGPYMNCGGVNQDTTPCTLTCTMPSKLSTGIYTLWWKWDWQGGAKYSTCADISVIATNTQSTTGPATPSTTGPSTTAAPVVPSTTGPSTTGVPKPSTTGVPKPSTTAAPVIPSTTGPSTTGVPKPSTTGVPKPSTTGVSTPSTTGSPSTPFSSTCANVPLVSSNSQATILSVDTWGAGSSAMFRAVVTVKASESVLTDWLLQFVFPSNAGNAKINSVVNAGSKLCESSSPVLHDMIQPVGWSKQIASGEYVTIEILGTNPAGLSKSDIQSNSAVTVFRRS